MELLNGLAIIRRYQAGRVGLETHRLAKSSSILVFYGTELPSEVGMRKKTHNHALAAAFLLGGEPSSR